MKNYNKTTPQTDKIEKSRALTIMKPRSLMLSGSEKRGQQHPSTMKLRDHDSFVTQIITSRTLHEIRQEKSPSKNKSAQKGYRATGRMSLQQAYKSRKNTSI